MKKWLIGTVFFVLCVNGATLLYIHHLTPPRQVETRVNPTINRMEWKYTTEPTWHVSEEPQYLIN